jgi:crossover junction endodeoxyribonuclease RusA
MNSLTVTLPWPSADLSPNSRNKWAMIKATKAAKHYACYMAQSLMGPLGIARGSWIGPVSVQYTFHPAMIRGRDDDNFAGRMKSARDGIAMALGIDDVKFSQQPVVFGEARKGAPCVIVTLTPASIKGAGK